MGSIHTRVGIPDAQAVVAAWGEPVAGIVLFGSVARGSDWDTSDVDLLIVLPTGSAITRELYDRWDRSVAPLMPARLSPSFAACPVAGDEAGGIWYECAADGVVLWDPDRHVSNLLEELRRLITAGKIVRRYSHGQPYWVRPEAA